MTLAMELGHLPHEKATYEDYVGRGAVDVHGGRR